MNREAQESRPAQNDIVQKLAQIVYDVSGVTTPAETTDIRRLSFIDDLDIDSLSMVEVTVAVEQEFDVQIPDERIKTFNTIGNVADYIVEYQAIDVG
ncbi:acyl carrier protein [Streptomyces sp. NPDC055085]